MIKLGISTRWKTAQLIYTYVTNIGVPFDAKTSSYKARVEKKKDTGHQLVQYNSTFQTAANWLTSRLKESLQC